MAAINSPWSHIRRTPYQSLAAILTMFLTFLLAGIVGISSFASHMILMYFESKPQLTVFFMEKAGKPEADSLVATLKQTGKVASTKFVSKDEALAIYRQQNKNDPLLLEMVTTDVLPASLEVTAVDPSYLKDLEPVIKGAQGVEEVVFQRDVVDALIKWTNGIRIIGTVFALLLAFDSLLILMTVIGMKIALRKDELEILRLIGASPWYIKRPFVLEGALYGWIGSFVAWIVIMGGIVWGRTALLSFLGVIPSISALLSSPTGQPFLVFAAAFFVSMVVSGAMLGSIGSLIASGRYVRS